MADRVRVLIADDHTMFRQGVREMLTTDPGIEVVAEAEDGQKAVRLAEMERPDVVLLDIEMPRMGAAGALERMLRLSPPPRVVVVTMHDTPRVAREFLDRGASGFLSKTASLEELLQAVRTAASSPPARGGAEVLALPPEVLDRVGEEPAGEPTARELEILLL
ncbi:MAG: response regulator transcription factor, partial [Actinomycetota bacterium]